MKEPSITVHDGPNGRFYHVSAWSPVNGCYSDDYIHIFPSVTTILSRLTADGIAEWRESIGHDIADRISAVARFRGTMLHHLVEKYVRGETIDWFKENQIIVEDFRTIQPYLDKYLSEVIAVEMPLWSLKLWTAGRVDLIGLWDGKLNVIDFKTARKPKTRAQIIPYLLQATCYAMMYNDMYDADIQDFQIVMAVRQDQPILFPGKVEKYKPWVEKLFCGRTNNEVSFPC